VVANIGADWLAAVGTIAAVVIAVGIQFLIWWREKRRRPLLTLEHDRDHSQVELDPDYEALPSIRLRVANSRDKDAADGVEVLVQETQSGGMSKRRTGTRPSSGRTRTARLKELWRLASTDSSISATSRGRQSGTRRSSSHSRDRGQMRAIS
jgi:hypothetical protein